MPMRILGGTIVSVGKVKNKYNISLKKTCNNI